MSDSKPIGFRVDNDDVTANQLHMIENHVYTANTLNWKPEWLGSEIGHVWEKADAWVVLQGPTCMTLYPGKDGDTFDMISFLHFIGVSDDKIWRNN